MSERDDPVRLSNEGSGASSELRSALTAARNDVPSPELVEAMLARFPFPPPGSGGPSAPSGPAAPGPSAPPGPVPIGATGAVGGAGLVKWIGVAVVASLASAAVYVATRSDPEVPKTSSAVAPTASEFGVEPAPTSARVEATSVAPSPEESALASAPVSATAPKTSALATGARPSASASASAPARSELEILREAHAASKSDPARALALVEEHRASYPKSAMGQEREMIRIIALFNQGKRAEARALADAFKRAHPGSAYAKRLDDMFQ